MAKGIGVADTDFHIFALGGKSGFGSRLRRWQSAIVDEGLLPMSKDGVKQSGSSAAIFC